MIDYVLVCVHLGRQAKWAFNDYLFVIVKPLSLRNKGINGPTCLVHGSYLRSLGCLTFFLFVFSGFKKIILIKKGKEFLFLIKKSKDVLNLISKSYFYVLNLYFFFLKKKLPVNGPAR